MMAMGQFYLFSLVLGTLGSLCVLFTVYWVQHWRGGFGWDGTNLMFNWHPVLMVTGMVVLYGAASLVYRLPQSWVGPKLPWKLLHAVLHLVAFILAVLGLVAVFNFHYHNRISNLYSLHSWLGITAVALFACQPPQAHPCLLWGYHPVPVHGLGPFRNQREALLQSEERNCPLLQPPPGGLLCQHHRNAGGRLCGNCALHPPGLVMEAARTRRPDRQTASVPAGTWISALPCCLHAGCVRALPITLPTCPLKKLAS
ncbi:lysosomal membrane ascorbate-dependent ferrireductase CYB561A3 isoform X2 [Phascolarctos cinereus]